MPFLGKVPSQIVDSDVDIDGGTIDGATIGSITAGAGTFTNLSATGAITFPDDGISGDDINGGTISNFTSTGIDDNATSTAITIDSSENVGIGETAPDTALHVKASNAYITVEDSSAGGTRGIDFVQSTGDSSNRIVSGDGGVLRFQYGASYTESMRIDSSGNVLIGNTAQIGTEKLNVSIISGGSAYSTSSMQSSALAWLNNAENDLTKASTLVLRQFNAASAISGLYTGTLNAALTFGTSSSGSSGNVVERMRIDSSGNLLVGRTNINFGSGTNGAFTLASGRFLNEVSGDTCLALNRTDGTGSAAIVFFYRGNLAAGQINAASGGTPAFASSSDIRLKNNVTDHESELSNVMSLRPVRWDWNNLDGVSGEGFIAQELEQTAWADLVSEGDDGYKQVSGLGTVETRLIKALQEAVTRIETLEAEVAALKGA